MTGKPREPRPKAPGEVPLDDGPREGTHAWREVEGVEFCHWDRWLLRLSLDEPEGLRSIAKEFRRRARAPASTNDVAEAMLAQIADLETRLADLLRLEHEVSRLLATARNHDRGHASAQGPCPKRPLRHRRTHRSA
jgi:hypothetical protein